MPEKYFCQLFQLLPDLGLPDIKWWVDLEFLDLASGPPAKNRQETGENRFGHYRHMFLTSIFVTSGTRGPCRNLLMEPPPGTMIPPVVEINGFQKTPDVKGSEE